MKTVDALVSFFICSRKDEYILDNNFPVHFLFCD